MRYYPAVDPNTGAPVVVVRPGETRQLWMDFSSLLYDSRLTDVTDISVDGPDENVTVSETGDAKIEERSVMIEADAETADTDTEYEVRITALTEDGETLVGNGMIYIREY